MKSGFGAMVVCCKDDFSCAKGSVASARRFMPDVPACLLIDGPFYPPGIGGPIMT